MINSIKIKCPLCDEVSELYLSINPVVIILKCPECWTPLMFTQNEIRILSEHELKTITTPSLQSIINNFFDKTMKKSNLPDKGHHDENLIPFPQRGTVKTMQGAAGPGARSNISPDDIIDLHKVLSTCNDVNQFIKNF